MKFFNHIKGWLTNRNNLLRVVFILIGMSGGFLYYYLIGCRTGSCPITSSPWLSMLWGAAFGYLISDFFRKKETPQTGNKGEEN